MDLLPPERWYAPNRQALIDWLSAKAAEAASAKPLVAIFDWDNTAVFGDVEETLFQYGLERLAFRVSPAELDRLLPADVDGLTELQGGVQLADIAADIRAAYRGLWPYVQRGEIEAARKLHEHADFCAKVGWLYDGLAATPGVGEQYAYRWITYWLAGMTQAQLQGLARAAFVEAMNGPIERRTWPSATAGRAGRLEYHFTHGLRAQPEIRALMEALQTAGINVCVVSASVEWVVEAAAKTLDYPIDAERIYGVRLKTKADLLLPELVDEKEYPFTYRQGKADLIARMIGGEPIFVAGDSDTDYEMLTGFASLQCRLVINRNKKGHIRKLYDEALKPAVGRPRTLLQGRDDNAGRFQPNRETTPLGKAVPTPLR